MNDNQQLCLLGIISLCMGYFLYDIFRYVYKNLDMNNKTNLIICYICIILSLVTTFILPLIILVHLG